MIEIETFREERNQKEGHSWQVSARYTWAGPRSALAVQSVKLCKQATLQSRAPAAHPRAPFKAGGRFGAPG